MHKRKLVYTLVGIVVIALGSMLATVITSTVPELGLDLQGGLSVTYEPVGEYTEEALNQVPELYRQRIDAYGVSEPEVLREGNNIIVNLAGIGEDERERAIGLIGATGKVLLRPVIGSTPIPLARCVATENGQGIPQPTVTTPETITVGSTVPGSTVPGSSVPGVTVPGSTAPGSSVPGSVVPAATLATTPETGTAPATSAPGGSRRPMAAATTIPVTSAAPTTAATTAPATSAPDSSTATTSSESTPTTAPGTTAPGSTVPGDTAAPPAGDPEPLDPDLILSAPSADVAEQSVTLAGARDEDDRCNMVYQLGPAFAKGESALESAAAENLNGQWQVSLTLKNGAGGLDVWNQWAGICFQRGEGCPQGGMAIVLDHRVISAPVPQEPVFTTNRISITGDFDEAEAKDLAQVLSYGATPVETRLLNSQLVTATLGDKALRAAVIAGAIGIVLVLLLMLLYYRTLALVVVGGLIVSGSIIWSIMAVLSHQKGLKLSLAGITGIIVSVGVTVDSYVVFFERLKDEVRSGKTLRSSAQRGYMGAWRTIVAADVVSLIGAGALYLLSVGSVRGFAFYLGLSTACDLVVSWFFTRPTILLLARSDRFRDKSVLGIRSGEAYAGGAAS